MENENQLQKKWYSIYYKKRIEIKKFEKVIEWAGLIVIIAVGIYAFAILHQL